MLAWILNLGFAATDTGVAIEAAGQRSRIKIYSSKD